MPMPEILGPGRKAITQDWGFNLARDWRLEFCWFPKRCFLSNQILWGKFAYHGQNILTGPGDPIVEDYWLEKNEFLIWQIKQAGEIKHDVIF